MPFQQKVETAEALTDLLRTSKGTVILDYRGLNVADISALRRRLKEQSVDLRVAKNTLLRRAAAAAHIEGIDELLAGPTAIASSTSDEVAPARLIAEAARVPRTPLSIKGGIYGARGVSADEVRSIAELPSRDIMLSRVLGVVQAPASATLSIAQAPARQVLHALNALAAAREAMAA